MDQEPQTIKVIGKYRFLSRLGQGTFGIVYRAREMELDIDRAVKVLHPLLIADPQFIENFRREAKMTAPLEHRNIVPVYEFSEQDGVFYLAMKYMPGGSLKDLILKRGELTYDQALGILNQAAAGLDYAHSKGLIHRDVKPANILFDEDGQARLADFGFAKAWEGSSSSSLSASGGMIGTPAYMAPETWRGRSSTPATDIYSLGCVFYEMLTGKVLFEGVSPAEVMTRHVLDGPQFPAQWPDGTPQNITSVLERALERDPAARLSNAGEFTRALTALLSVPDTKIVMTPPKTESNAFPPNRPNSAVEIKPDVEQPFSTPKTQVVPALSTNTKKASNENNNVRQAPGIGAAQPSVAGKSTDKAASKQIYWLGFGVLGVGVLAIILILSWGILPFLTSQTSKTATSAVQNFANMQPTDSVSGISSDTSVATNQLLTTAAMQIVPIIPPTPSEPGLLRVNLGSYPDIIDPQKSSFVNEIAHLQLMYEGLTRLDKDLLTVPGAAEKWEYNADATEVTFTLRPDLKYADGTILNAKRFEYALLRNINPYTAGEYAQITDDIAGAVDWRYADTSAEGYDGEALKAGVMVQALDAAGAPCADYEQADCLTLKIGLTKRAPYFHTVMSLWVGYPAKEENISEGGDDWWNSSKYQVGNGPFILKNLEPFVRGYFTPNPNYWRGQASYEIEYSYVTDTAMAFEAYKNNEFDIVSLEAEYLGTVQNDTELNAQALIYPGSCTFALMFHQLKAPFTDQKVREAFAYGLNREGWVTDVLKGLGAPTLTWIPKGYPGYQDGETRLGFDPEKAKQMIAESSYGSVEALPEITVTFSDTPRNRTRWEWIVAKWEEVLGVDFKFNPVESTTYTELTKDISTAPQMFILGWCADYPDPQNWLSVYWKTGGFGARIGYSNSELDALLDQADVDLDPARRMELYAQAQDMLVAGSPVAFMYNNVNTYLVKPWVKGITQTPQDSGWAGIQDPLSITIETPVVP